MTVITTKRRNKVKKTKLTEQMTRQPIGRDSRMKICPNKPMSIMNQKKNHHHQQRHHHPLKRMIYQRRKIKMIIKVMGLEHHQNINCYEGRATRVVVEAVELVLPKHLST